MGDKQGKLNLSQLVLMIFTTVFGFANMPRAFYLMGYGAILWYVLAAVAFLIPFAFMIAEYGAAFKTEKGGIYSWMEKSVGEKYAFVGTFMWYAAYLIWMVNISSSIWIPLSNAITGKDTTNTWGFLGLNSTQSLGVLGCVLIIVITAIATRGIDKIKKVTSTAGIFVMLLNVILILGAIIIFVLNDFTLAQPISTSMDFINSPNPDYQSVISILSFSVFAIFAYGGIEVVGGLVDETENPTRTFPKGIILAATVIAIGYSLGILMCGVFTNWNDALSFKTVHMGNVAYVLMRNLGYQLGLALDLAESTALNLGLWISRFVGLSMFFALVGAFFTGVYSPLRQLIEGTPESVWPKKIAELEDGVPRNAMIAQCIIVVVIILLVSFGGEGASRFFSKLVLMTNVAMTIPYMFIAGAFYSFKRKKEIEKPFEIYKGEGIALIGTIATVFVVGFANVFTIISPAINGDWSSTLWMIAGPIFFSLVALIIYGRSKRVR
ncbi:glutamate/gamma-aminobutyrate family transporter YjeM [Clostridium sp. B9]|uniref:glutamate/gamma-aminobutyrate family transporter YjeM n=1 Tax=Clostridium sp. B9 TaxID=3423224 RepID=UPI003D2EE422